MIDFNKVQILLKVIGVDSKIEHDILTTNLIVEHSEDNLKVDFIINCIEAPEPFSSIYLLKLKINDKIYFDTVPVPEPNIKEKIADCVKLINEELLK